MKLHIAEKEGWIGLVLSEVKIVESEVLKLKNIRLKASNWDFSKEDNFYIEFLPDELLRILRDSYSLEELESIVKKIEIVNRMYNEKHCHKNGKVYFCSECKESTYEKCIADLTNKSEGKENE